MDDIVGKIVNIIGDSKTLVVFIPNNMDIYIGDGVRYCWGTGFDGIVEVYFSNNEFMPEFVTKIVAKYSREMYGLSFDEEHYMPPELIIALFDNCNSKGIYILEGGAY